MVRIVTMLTVLLRFLLVGYSIDPFDVLAGTSAEVEQAADVLVVPLHRGERNFTDNTAELLPELRHSRKRVETVLVDDLHLYGLELDGQILLYSISCPSVFLSSIVVIKPLLLREVDITHIAAVRPVVSDDPLLLAQRAHLHHGGGVRSRRLADEAGEGSGGLLTFGHGEMPIAHTSLFTLRLID